MRRITGAILSAALCAGSALAATRATAPPPPLDNTSESVLAWRNSYIDPGPFVYQSFTENSAVYLFLSDDVDVTKDAVRAWVRTEFFSRQTASGVGFRSSNALWEFDCAGERLRYLAVDAYPYNNLQGEAVRNDAQSPEWQYPRPGTLGEGQIEIICAAKEQMLAELLAKRDEPQDDGPRWTVVPERR